VIGLRKKRGADSKERRNCRNLEVIIDDGLRKEIGVQRKYCLPERRKN
jgi:hypothetical protein